MTAFLGVTYGSGTSPTSTQVETLIAMSSDEIDQRTHHAWRETTVTNEIHNLDLLRVGWYGVPIYLKHRAVKTWSSTTDKLEIRYGSTWEDWSTKGDDYFTIFYEQGIMYLKTWDYSKIKAVRITYRYGDASVPNDIKEAAVKLTAMKLVSNEGFWNDLPSGGSGIDLATRIQIWKEDVDRIIENRAEVVAIVGI